MNKGFKHSEETKHKMRLKALGIGNSQYGKKHTEEHKRKIGDAVSGKKHPMFGKHHTPEAILKIKEARAKQIIPKGRKLSEEIKKKIFTTERIKRLQDTMARNTFGFKKGKKAWNSGLKLPHLSGSNSPQWKGGITPINQKIRGSLEYNLWERSVIERDNHTCQKCGAKARLVAHHILNFSDYPEIRFELSNGITFCRKDCHKMFHRIYGRKNNTKEQVEEFIKS